MTSATSAETWGADFVELPPADAPPAPHEPGGSLGLFDTGRWKPDEIETVVIETVGGYVTLQTASELFNVQRERLQVACWRGSLPGKRAGGSDGKPGPWYVHPGDVARYLATTLRGVSNRRRADETSPQRLKAERERLLRSAAHAERTAAAKRAKLATVSGLDKGNLELRAVREEMYARNRRRVADGVARLTEALVEAKARQEAWFRGGGVDPDAKAAPYKSFVAGLSSDSLVRLPLLPGEQAATVWGKILDAWVSVYPQAPLPVRRRARGAVAFQTPAVLGPPSPAT